MDLLKFIPPTLRIENRTLDFKVTLLFVIQVYDESLF